LLHERSCETSGEINAITTDLRGYVGRIHYELVPLGNVPLHDRTTVESALTALLRIWPEWETSLAANVRGLMIISPAIENGLILSACERLDGFANVLRRLKNGERSALSELTFAARMVKAGYRPSLEPPVGASLLDTCIPMPEGSVYCEVIAPETREAIQEVKAAASALARVLRDENKGRRVEVLLTADIDLDVSTNVAEAIKAHPESNEAWAIGETAMASKRLAGDDANVGPTIPAAETAAIIGTAQCSIENGVRSAGIVRVPVTDAHAKRLMYGESHHFSHEEMNLLVMDVTKVISSLKAWRRLIERCFQPEQIRRFGAVVLFSAGITGEKMSPLENWEVVPNPYAYKLIPESLLRKIVSPDSPP
jgi:hypothetical protein